MWCGESRGPSIQILGVEVFPREHESCGVACASVAQPVLQLHPEFSPLRRQLVESAVQATSHRRGPASVRHDPTSARQARRSPFFVLKHRRIEQIALPSVRVERCLDCRGRESARQIANTDLQSAINMAAMRSAPHDRQSHRTFRRTTRRSDHQTQGMPTATSERSPRRTWPINSGIGVLRERKSTTLVIELTCDKNVSQLRILNLHSNNCFIQLF